MKALAWLPALLAAGCIGLEPLYNDSGGPDGDDTGPDVIDYGDLHVEPGSVDFGQVSIGSSGEATVVVRFDGEGDTIISEASISGGSGTMVIRNMTGLPTAISGENEAIFELLFSPSSERSYYGELQISTDHPDAGQVVVGLDGEGLDDGGTESGADIAASPDPVDFGLVDVGSSQRRTVTVSNIGDEAFFLLDIETDPPTLEWDLDQYLPLEFDPGESREVTLEWSPVSIGTLEGEVVFVSDVPGEERLSILATGESDDTCDICAPMISVDTGGDPYAMTFFAITGLGPHTQQVRITNSGDQTLTIRDVYVNNDALAPAGEFSVNWGSSVSLDPWQGTQVNVSYVATGTAFDLPYPTFDMNILHIISDAANEPDYAIELTGTGI
jgi:hypothetical protein